MKFEIYLDQNSEYRWRLRARNGKILADSGEGYKRKASLLKSLAVVKSHDCYIAPIKDTSK